MGDTNDMSGGDANVEGCDLYEMETDDVLARMLVNAEGQNLLEMITAEDAGSITSVELDAHLDENHNDLITLLPLPVTSSMDSDDPFYGQEDNTEMTNSPESYNGQIKHEVESDTMVVAKEECHDDEEVVDSGLLGESECDDEEEDEGRSKEKPSLSYIALISLAIQSSPDKRMLLSGIYRWITKKYRYFNNQDRSWRNSVRHNLSLNECFVKAGRADNGKGHYWAIHPANQNDFAAGDFRRRHARRRVRSAEDPHVKPDESKPKEFNSCSQPIDSNHYVPMTTIQAPVHALVAMFGEDAIHGPAKKRRYISYHNALPFEEYPTFPTTFQLTHLSDVGVEEDISMDKLENYVTVDSMTSPSARERPSCMFAHT